MSKKKQPTKPRKQRTNPLLEELSPQSEQLSKVERQRQLRDGLITPRAECRTRDPDSRDLYYFWDLGTWDKLPDFVPAPERERFKKLRVREIAACYTVLLRRESLDTSE